MSRIIWSESEPSTVTVFQWRLLRWYPGATAECASRSCSASWGSHLRLTDNDSERRLESAKIFPATLNTDVSGPNGNVSSDPGKVRQ